MTVKENARRRERYATDENYANYYKEKSKRYFQTHKEEKKLYMRVYRRRKFLEKFNAI